MKKPLNFFLAILFFNLLMTRFHAKAQFGNPPPFTLEIEAVSQPVLGIHSFSYAQSGSKWLIVGGRINGLHGMSSNDNFPVQYANNSIVVIDTTTWQTYSATLNSLPLSIADPLRSTNMQFTHQNNWLYVLGGFGWDSTQNRYVTYSTLTAIHVNDMINAVMNNLPIAPHVRQISNTNFSVSGGELEVSDGKWHLVMGHDFQGRYTENPSPLFTQEYTNEIRKFSVSDDGTTLSASNFSAQRDTVNFHRRDLNVFPLIQQGGSHSIGVFGGVFRYNENLPYRSPIVVDSVSYQVNSYQQYMSQYTCAGIPIFDSVTNKMYVVLMGGISMYDYDPVSSTVVYDSLVPFVSDITCLTLHPSGQIEESILPLQLPDLLGSNAEFVPNLSLFRYENGVLKFRKLPSGRTLAGYLLGGIRAGAPNLQTGVANDTVYRIFINPDFTASIASPKTNSMISNLEINPNPVKEEAYIKFKLTESAGVKITLLNTAGEVMEIVSDKKWKQGEQQIKWNNKLPSGNYMLQVQSGNETKALKVVVVN